MQPSDRTDSDRATDNLVERVSLQISGQLAQRGVEVRDDDDAADRADILAAVEQFERAVQLCGGDSYTNALDSSRPDDARYVIPTRADDERPDAYVRRVRAAAAELAPPRGGGGPHPGSAV